MDTTKAVAEFQGNWFLRDQAKPDLTPAEQELIGAAVGPAPERWDGRPDVARMQETVAAEPAVLERIGSSLLTAVIGKRGCGPAAAFLLAHDVPLAIDHAAYNVLHEAAWAGAADTLRAVFESGVADATGVSVRPHTGWPDNLPLMYWAAWGGYPEVARLLIEYGAGVHHELPIRGNGERGTTSLQEALAPSHWDETDTGEGPVGELRRNARQGKLIVAQILIDDSACYDVYSASARDDTTRLRELISEDSGIVNAVDPYAMTPLHWAARTGSAACAELLIAAGAAIDARNRATRAPLQLAAEQDRAGMIRLLAAHGADLNTPDRKGRTPLHRATYEGKVAAVEALLQAGADPEARNKSGKTAFQIARKDAKRFKR